MCCWGFRCFRIMRCVAGLVFADVLKGVCSVNGLGSQCEGDTRRDTISSVGRH